MAKRFYNTVELSGAELEQAVKDATSQQQAIFLIYFNSRQKLTASDITKKTEAAGRDWPIWSNRRAITTLKKEGELVMLSLQKPGDYGKPEHFYQLNFLKYPSKHSTQEELFL